MVRRTARRGHSAGEDFWGCKGFPQCRGTQSITKSRATEQEQEGAKAPSGRLSTSSAPALFTAATRPHYQVQAYESVSLPAAVVAKANLGDVPENVSRAFSGWRLDLPMPRTGLSAERRAIALLAEEILLRGTIPIASPGVERWIADRYSMPWADISAEELAQLLTASASAPPSPHQPECFDSDEERLLVERIQKAITQGASGWAVQTQVHVSYLVARMPPGSRCDVLLTHPDGRRAVVELDGQQHLQHAQADQAYDDDLIAAGFDVIRITTSELRAGQGPGWTRLGRLLRPGSSSDRPSLVSDWMEAFRTAHQAQVTALSALRSGHLEWMGEWEVGVSGLDAVELMRVALSDLREMLVRLSRLWDVPPAPLGGVQVQAAPEAEGPLTFRFGLDGSAPPYLVSDVVLPVIPQRNVPWAGRLPTPEAPNQEDAEWFLHWIYRKDSFWEGQWPCVRRALRGEDTLVLLPTGRGKSIAFQLAALLRPGPCIVVDPIVSLMDDQIDNLRTIGIDRTVGISGRQSANEKETLLHSFSSGHYKFCFVAPERFQSAPFRATLRALTVNSPVSLIAIDEAHCVSEWGHDFRTAYLNLGRTTRQYCAREGEAAPPLVGLTGTASRVVLKDVQRALGIQGVEAIITPTTFDRPELEFSVLRCRSDEKQSRLHGTVRGMPGRFGLTQGAFFRNGAGGAAGLVFCPHVNGEFGTAQVADDLSQALGTPVETYSGMRPKNRQGSWDQYKSRVARDFKRDRVQLLACTKAFGMGIDKPNIRFTVHYGLPQTVEAFYQEAGRSGRDQKPAHCVVILSVDHPGRAQKLLDPSTRVEEVAAEIDKVGWGDADDVTRALFFHAKSFAGVDTDLEMIEKVLDRVEGAGTDETRAIAWSGISDGSLSGDAEQTAAEKAVHHLVTLGVIRDYTMDWAKREFHVVVGEDQAEELARALGDYGRAYQFQRGEKLERDFLASAPGTGRDRVLQASRKLLEFIYETVELARRRGLSEMLQAAQDAATSPDGPTLLKERILLYLTQTDWDVRLDDLRADSGEALAEIHGLAEEVVSTHHAEELRAAAARQLSSYPDQPIFLLLRAFAEACVAETDWERAREDVRAAIGFAVEKYDMNIANVGTSIAELARLLESRGRPAERFLDQILGARGTSRELQRALCRSLPNSLAVRTIRPLMEALALSAVRESATRVRSPNDR